MGLRHGHSLVAGHCFNHFVAGVGQQIAHDLTVILLILDYQNPPVHITSNCGPTSMGSENKKVEPLPMVD